VSVTDLLQSYPKNSLEYFDRALENLAHTVNHPTTKFHFDALKHRAMFCEGMQVSGMVTQLMDAGFLSWDADSKLHSISAKGWERVAALQRTGRDAKQAFVAMWFEPTMAPFYEEGFKPAIEEDKTIKALRIDRKDHNNKIDDEIVAEIRRSRYLVADFTGHRGGVYFEAGFALGLGLPVVWTCKKDHIDDAHFDTRQYNHITYETPEELRVKLLNRIRATIS